jgi:hypothetical protein
MAAGAARLLTRCNELAASSRAIGLRVAGARQPAPCYHVPSSSRFIAGLFRVLDLEPRVAPAGSVRRIAPLADDVFEAELAGVLWRILTSERPRAS